MPRNQECLESQIQNKEQESTFVWTHTYSRLDLSKRKHLTLQSLETLPYLILNLFPNQIHFKVLTC